MKSWFISCINFFVILTFSSTQIQSIDLPGNKLKIESGKVLFILLKTEDKKTSKMTGIGRNFSGTINLETKKINIISTIDKKDFFLIESYKFANELMHEGYMESKKFPTANFTGNLISLDKKSGKVKAHGALTIHGIKKENLEIKGNLKKEDNELIFKSNFKLEPKEFNLNLPKVKEIDVNIKFRIVSE